MSPYVYKNTFTSMKFRGTFGGITRERKDHAPKMKLSDKTCKAALAKDKVYKLFDGGGLMAQIIGINKDDTNASTTVYDPTCGSGSLLLKVGDEAGTSVTLYGQEKDAATSGLARMNMILHNNPTASIMQGNTLSDPKFKDGDSIKQFNYVVANPPFSDKRWSNGIDPLDDEYDRFEGFGIPPAKQGDYAYLLHIIRSLKSKGKGACILPHGVLFRGNAEAEIRKSLVRKGYIKGIIGLPPNLFYGTGIPACIVMVDKEGAAARKGIFMIDASAGFIKDGAKNRLRSQDLHKIVDAFTKLSPLEGYSRMVPYEEIEKNDYNLNIPRYIDTQKSEDKQDIEGHLRGGIPQEDIESLQSYWDVCPDLKNTLFKECRDGYFALGVDKQTVKNTIFEHPQFISFVKEMDSHFEAWKMRSEKTLKALKSGCNPKEVIFNLSEDLLRHYTDKPLINKYDVYQHIMNYWSETMQDDCYLISADGWKAETYRIIEKDKKGKEKDKGWACGLIPKNYIVSHFFKEEQENIETLNADLENTIAEKTELEEEHSGDEGVFTELDKINKGNVNAYLKELKDETDTEQEQTILKKWMKLYEKEAKLKKDIKTAEAELDTKAYEKYPKLKEEEIKTIVVNDKWLARLEADIDAEIDRISQNLTSRVKTLSERYELPLPKLVEKAANYESKVENHLKAMGFKW